ncbi:MAG: lytic transglycosylase domain-containing protein [Polymorphobacter sp.]|uniref:lytic transglycosylase domain-containing protein n=1 Tax=Polymorphobacter sp. TaxID=1909290 RepID=UPI003A88259C
MRIETGAVGIANAVRQAAVRTGTDFGFLMAQARSESGLRADAQAATSSARGLFQFTRATWLDMVAKHGGAHDALARAADALKKGGPEKMRATAERAVLALRDDPFASSLMAGALARDNAAGLEARLGRAPDAGEVHLAHVLGLSGATRFLGALARNPGAAAADVVPKAAAANRAIFYGADREARSLADVMARIADKVATGVKGAVGAAPAAEPVPEADRSLQARMAYLLLAEMGG